ncbi:tyrosine recombinase XerS (plasmid) [Priestia koreensis]|nr:tyrosine recombinase XerS [Priestia koreensis]
MKIMPISRQHQIHEERLKEMVMGMPFYVQQFVDDKLDTHSSSTLLGYLHDYKLFFDWLMAEGFAECNEIKDIPLEALEKLPLEAAKSFFKFVNRKDVVVSKKKNEKKKPEKVSTNRKISALRSLFKYLTVETENQNQEPYFYRNVMQKITVHKKKETLNARSGRISKTIFHKDEDIQFLSFLKYEYLNTISPKAKPYFLRDIERDYAVISLFLGSGVRVNELANLRLRDLNFSTNEIAVIRKGNKEDIVSVVPQAMQDVKEYLDIRLQRYRARNDEDDSVFVTRYQGSYTPLSVRTIQHMVKKYSKAFQSNKSLSPHKLRHTYATQLVEETGDLVLVMNQLGHSSMNTAVLYTNSDKERAREAAKKLGKKREDL